jgi:hypothetical protein
MSRLLVRTLTLALPCALALAVLAAPVPATAAAQITIVNVDGPGEGFNDPTPAPPVGGNPGTTLGEQRLIAFQFAANIWGSALDSPEEIRVQASFDPLPPNVLGAAGATFVFSDFLNAGFANTWYHSALADKLAGDDLAATFGFPGAPDLVAFFSSNFNFYLGLDNDAGAQPDLVVVLLHEFAHGLGFANFVNEATGANLAGQTDVFSQYTLDTSTGKLWSAMTNAERAASAVNFDKVVWVGPRVSSAVPSVLDFGVPALTINAPLAIAGTLRVGSASFGPPVSVAGVAGELVLADDGVGTGSDACEPLTPASATAVAGQIALVDRGTCAFTIKVKNAQDAGAVATVVADNVAGAPPPGLGGADPTIVIPSVRITLADGNAIKGQLGLGETVSGVLSLDLSIRAGADPDDQALLNAPNPVQPGSSISHWDPIAFPNQLMEPAINADLTHSVIPPADTTLPQMRDVGWFLDENLDSVADQTVFVAGCDSRVPNVDVVPGVSIADQVKACAANAPDHGAFVSCVAHLTNQLVRDRIINGRQKGAIQSCAARSPY